jgi:hypothetical protein
MSIETTSPKQMIHDKLESRINSVSSKLETLKARAETAKASAEIKAVADLAVKKVQLQQKLQELKNSADHNWEEGKKHLDSLVADFEKRVKAIETKAHAN